MTRLPFLALLLVLAPRAGHGHGGTPRVIEIRFPVQRPGEVWAVTDNQGLFARTPEGFRWLCDDAVTRDAGIRALTPMGDGPSTWLAATNFGVFRSKNGGCDYDPVEGELAGHVPMGLYPHPDVPDEVLTATETLGRPNDVFLSTDGGLGWQAAGLAVDGRIHPPLVRALADPDVVYVAHAAGAARSEDGGRTFEPIAPGPAELEVAPEELFLLTTHPRSADEVYAVVERFPESIVIRSRDGGRSWIPVLRVEDVPGGLVFDREGRRGLMTTPFEGVFRTADGGETWEHVQPGPVELLDCVTREPGTDRLWGCTNIFFGGPWALGVSDDFGATWQPVLASFRDVAEPWGCPAGSAARRECDGLCPGLDRDATCGADAGPTDPDAGPSPPDAARPPPRDAGTDDDASRPTDAAAVADASARSDAAPMTTTDGAPPRADTDPGGGGADGGCAATPAPRLAPGVLFALWALRSRRRRT